ncbi:hypothetical protein BHE74_00015090 [Ensete ventricosum]|nr:hypothetical protein BHE74_00015090 [Ensete ventricosum]
MTLTFVGGCSTCFDYSRAFFISGVWRQALTPSTLRDFHRLATPLVPLLLCVTANFVESSELHPSAAFYRALQQSVSRSSAAFYRGRGRLSCVTCALAASIRDSVCARQPPPLASGNTSRRGSGLPHAAHLPAQAV